MPFYEYQCRSCQHYLEVMQKITDAPLRKCPACGRLTLVKLISAPVFRLKGSGWYETDFKSDKESKRNLAGGDREERKPAEAAQAAEPAKSTAESTSPAPASAPATPPAQAAATRAAPKRARARARTKTSAPKRAKRASRGRSKR